ncbi:ABC transporter permease [Methanonatronarchaeum thermophilum]
MFSIIIISVLYASRFIAGEKTQKTLQLLVSRPVKRWKIIIGKYISFIVLFIPLLVGSVILMAIWIDIIDIGRSGWDVFFSYVAATMIYSFVYSSIATLFSTISKNTTTAALGSFIFLVGWVIIDFLTIYMPEETAEIIEHVSLAHHANEILGYISNGEAAIFAAGGIPADPGTQGFLYSLIVIITLIILPILLAVLVFNRMEIN